jgi:hypothetical protein
MLTSRNVASIVTMEGRFDVSAPWGGVMSGRLRRGLWSALLVLLLVAAGSLAGSSGSHAATIPPPPTDLTMAWTTVVNNGEQLRLVRLSWQGSEATASYSWRTEVYNASTWSPRGPTGSTGPGVRTDSAESSRFPYRATVRFAVNAVLDGVPGPLAYSVAFDTNGPLTRLQSVSPQADGRVLMTWVPNLPGPDITPNDPLDLPGPYHYQVVAGVGGPGDYYSLRALGPPTTAYSASFTPHTPNFGIGVANDNEWRPVSNDSGWRSVATAEADARGLPGTRLSASVPRAGTYSLPIAVTGRVTNRVIVSCMGGCDVADVLGAGRRVVLHARNTPSSPWYAVTTATSDADGLFRILVKAPGTRQYRVLVLGVPWPNAQQGGAQAGAMTAPVASITVTRVVSARFTDPYAYGGQKVTAALRVLPAGTQRATLQRWTGTRWVDMKWVYLRAGLGSHTFTAVQRGVVGYRYVIPAGTAGGLPVEGTTTAPFYLKTT